ncbi:hypothetical protein [Achromobacter sp. 413638]|uniref:hypothetical protein n=1 Tax=Achromobacter sp. 413638 TaxID=3342385 RepID=UPI00370C36C8
MTLTADASALSYWYTLARACDEGDGAKHIGIGANGLPCLAPSPPPRVDKHANAGAVTPYQQFLTLITGASHGVARLMLERDIDPEEKLAPSLRLSTVKTCLQHAGFWEGHRLPDDWPALPDSLQGARVLPDRESNLPQAFDQIQAAVQKRISEAYARLPAGAGTPAKLAAIMQLLCDASALRERLGKEYVDAIRNLLSLEAAQLRFASALRDSGFPCFAQMRNPLRDGYRLLMDGDDADFCNPALYEDERGYMAAMMTAFTNMLGVVRENRRLDGALFEQYHRWAVEGVKHDNGTDLPRNYRDNAWVTYGADFGDGDLGVNRKLEWFERREKYSPRQLWSELKGAGGHMRVHAFPRSEEQCRAKADQIINAHYERMALLQDTPGHEREALVLASIAECCQTLEQHHLFPDGNIRTIAFLVLNHMLLEENMLPVTPHDPNRLDDRTGAEMVELIRQWQNRFKALQATDAQ